MGKTLKDYMHLYLGCEFLYKIDGHEESKMILTVDQLSCYYSLFDDPECHYKLILRPLSDMTEEEKKTGNVWSCNLNKYPSHPTGFYTPMEFQYLLFKGFDLFGLIESGLAINPSQL